MPVLEMTGDKYMDPAAVVSVMAHPEDDSKREQLLDVLWVGVLSDAEERRRKKEVSVPIDRLKRALLAPSVEEVISRSKESFWGGSIAGCVFRNIHMMEVYGVGEPSIRKAIWLEIQLNQQQRQSKKLPTSEPTIRRYWEDFKSVAHFWAAYLVDCQSDDGVIPHIGVQFCEWQDCQEKLRHFLRMAEYFRVWGEEFIPARLKDPKPILSPDKTWRIAEEYIDGCELIRRDGFQLNERGLYLLRELLDRYPKRQYYDC